jgi:hypothetical protein
MRLAQIILLWSALFFGLIQTLMAQKTVAQDTLPKTLLSIVQGKDSLVILDNTREITLKADSFLLYFTTQNTDCVFLNVSYDSIAYHYAGRNELHKIDLFTPPQTFSEYSKNPDHEVFVVDNVSDGYHCLFAFSEDEEFIRFDKVMGTQKSNWIGLRTVSSMFNSAKNNVPIKDLKGKTIYFVFSPGIIEQGKPLKIHFK